MISLLTCPYHAETTELPPGPVGTFEDPLFDEKWHQALEGAAARTALPDDTPSPYASVAILAPLLFPPDPTSPFPFTPCSRLLPPWRKKLSEIVRFVAGMMSRVGVVLGLLIALWVVLVSKLSSPYEWTGAEIGLALVMPPLCLTVAGWIVGAVVGVVITPLIWLIEYVHG